VYGDLALRIFSDLDILVHSEDAIAAWNLLEEKGFRPELDLDDRQKQKFVKTEDNLSFSLKNRSIVVELHWELSGCYLSAPLTFDQMRDDLCRVSVLDKEVQTLCPEMLLVYLCIHGAKDGWNYIEQVCSVTEIVRRKKELDWLYLEELASRWKCRRIVRLGLRLAEELFSAPVPERISETIQKDQAVKKVSGAIMDRLLRDSIDPEGDPHNGRFSFMHLRLKDSYIEKVRYAVKLAFSPTKKEWLHYPLPAKWSFLHYVLRPYRLARAGLGK